MLEEQFEYAHSDPERSHEIYHEDAVLEFPQSGERFDGVAGFREWRSQYPIPTTPVVKRVRGGGDVWVAEISIAYDGGTPQFGVSILEFHGDRVTRETIYVNEGWEAPDWRAPWRSAP